MVVCFTANETVHEWRLVDGSVESEGRLEFRFIGGKWRSVCSNKIDNLKASLICKELGYSIALSWYLHETSFFGGNNEEKFILNMDESRNGCSSKNIVSLRCLIGS